MGIKGEKQREQNRLAEKKKVDRSLIEKAKQELRAFLGRNQNEGSEAVANISRVESRDENKTERKKEQERRERTGSTTNSESTFYKSMSIVEARKELERMEKENKEKQESSKREEEKKRREQERKEDERK